jgi:hypothetical protein
LLSSADARIENIVAATDSAARGLNWKMCIRYKSELLSLCGVSYESRTSILFYLRVREPSHIPAREMRSHG